MLARIAVATRGTPEVDACVSAIEQATSCEIVALPETAPACAFLKPVVPVDAGAETSPDDATDLDAPGSTEGGG